MVLSLTKHLGCYNLAPEKRSIPTFFFSLARHMLARAPARGDFGCGEMARNS
jgi:hypothetical protein